MPLTMRPTSRRSPVYADRRTGRSWTTASRLAASKVATLDEAKAQFQAAWRQWLAGPS